MAGAHRGRLCSGGNMPAGDVHLDQEIANGPGEPGRQLARDGSEAYGAPDAPYFAKFQGEESVFRLRSASATTRSNCSLSLRTR